MVRAIIGSLVVIGIGSELVTQTSAQAQDNASDQSRPAEVEILRTMEDGGGSGLELHGVTISGVTRDPSGSPVAGADVFVCSSVRSWPSDFELNRGRTQSDEQGRFELKNVRLLVTRDRPDPLPKPVEGGFVVFAVKEAYGIQGIPHAAVIDQEGNLAFVGDFGPALRAVERQLQRVK